MAAWPRSNDRAEPLHLGTPCGGEAFDVVDQCVQRDTQRRGELSTHQRREMTVNTESGLDGEYLPNPAERVRNQVADHESSGGVAGRTREVRPR
jgi:hypothetical protein